MRMSTKNGAETWVLEKPVSCFDCCRCCSQVTAVVGMQEQTAARRLSVGVAEQPVSIAVGQRRMKLLKVCPGGADDCVRSPETTGVGCRFCRPSRGSHCPMNRRNPGQPRQPRRTPRSRSSCGCLLPHRWWSARKKRTLGAAGVSAAAGESWGRNPPTAHVLHLHLFVRQPHAEATTGHHPGPWRLVWLMLRMPTTRSCG